MLLTSEQVSSIFGQNQILTATWRVHGGFVLRRGATDLTISSTEGLTIRDGAGDLGLSIPLNVEGPFVFGRPSKAVEPAALVHIGNMDWEGLDGAQGFRSPSAILAGYKTTAENQAALGSGLYLRHDFGSTSYVLGQEVWCYINPPSGAAVSFGGGSVVGLQTQGAGDPGFVLWSLRADTVAGSTNASGTSSYYGVWANTSFASGSVSDIASVVASIVLSSGSVASLHGLYISQSGPGSPATVAYGVRIASLKGTTQHSFYCGLVGALLTNAGPAALGTDLATTATDGFVYIASCAGTPTGVPTSRSGLIPLVYDRTNNILYAYSNGTWRAH